MAAPKNLALAQLRQTRVGRSTIDDGVSDRKFGRNSHRGILVALGGYMRDTDAGVEHLKAMIGGRA